MPTASFTTLGCKVNQYETQKIIESFVDAGFGVVPFGEVADVVVINSCSVTSIAESKSRYTIRRAQRDNPDAKVVVTGCASQMALNKREEMPGADLIVPNPEKLDALRFFLQKYPELKPKTAEKAQATPQRRTRATLKIQDGCSVFCSYCSIPYTRPVMASRHADDVLREAQMLAGQGFKEIILTGVLIGSYGPETGSGGPDFCDLVRSLAQNSGVPRIRISSIEMQQVSPELIGLIKEGLVVPHLHIPLQSGDTDVLRDMNRPYNQADYLGLIANIRKQVPGITITTDIMVGFPTEDESRFESSLHVVREANFYEAHVFSFSPRFGTPADQLGDPVPLEVKHDRRHRLTESARQNAADIRANWVGKTVRVLVEAKPVDGLLDGLSDDYLRVRFAGDPNLARQLAWVRLDEVRDDVFFGEQVPAPTRDLALLRQA